MTKTISNIYSHTKALCSECGKVVGAAIVSIDKKIFLQKFCPDHKIHYSLFCSDEDWFKDSINYVKPSQVPLDHSVKTFSGCPDSCGLCAEHQQHTCLPIIEITNLCDMDCPICLKSFNNNFQLSIDQFDAILETLKKCEGKIDVINLSGGEPTSHPELENFLRLANKKGVMQTTVSTNGKQLLNNEKLRNAFKENNAIVALQFDGFIPETYIKLRGENLVSEKMNIIDRLEKENINYSLVCTIARGINEKEIIPITNFFFESKALSIMFQPIVYTGKAEKILVDQNRITIPDIVNEIEKSTFAKKGDFNPLPCSHFSCFALSYYLILNDNEFLSLKDFLGKDEFLKIISNKTLPGLDNAGYQVIKEKIYQFWSASDSSNLSEEVLKRIKKIMIALSNTNLTLKDKFNIGVKSMKGIFIHQFMDKYTLDFGRLIKCCNHYPQSNGKIIPMCAQNIFFQ